MKVEETYVFLPFSNPTPFTHSLTYCVYYCIIQAKQIRGRRETMKQGWKSKERIRGKNRFNSLLPETIGPIGSELVQTGGELVFRRSWKLKTEAEKKLTAHSNSPLPIPVSSLSAEEGEGERDGSIILFCSLFCLNWRENIILYLNNVYHQHWRIPFGSKRPAPPPRRRCRSSTVTGYYPFSKSVSLQKCNQCELYLKPNISLPCRIQL